MSLFANDDNISFTGELVHQDSVMIAYDDLRIVNSKLIELDYEKQINANLRKVISNDSIMIQDYTTLNNKLNNDCKRYVRQKNICFGAGVTAILFAILFGILK